ARMSASCSSTAACSTAAHIARCSSNRERNGRSAATRSATQLVRSKMPANAATNCGAGSELSSWREITLSIASGVWRRFAGRGRMGADPVPGNIDSARDPDILVLEGVVEKALQAGNTTRPSDEPGMQSDRQHLWRIEPRWISLAIQRVECVAQIVEELCAGIEPLHQREAHVVTVERIRHHEVRYRVCGFAARHLCPVGEVVGVRVG